MSKNFSVCRRFLLLSYYWIDVLIASSAAHVITKFADWGIRNVWIDCSSCPVPIIASWENSDKLTISLLGNQHPHLAMFFTEKLFNPRVRVDINAALDGQKTCILAGYIQALFNLWCFCVKQVMLRATQTPQPFLTVNAVKMLGLFPLTTLIRHRH